MSSTIKGSSFDDANAGTCEVGTGHAIGPWRGKAQVTRGSAAVLAASVPSVGQSSRRNKRDDRLERQSPRSWGGLGAAWGMLARQRYRGHNSRVSTATFWAPSVRF